MITAHQLAIAVKALRDGQKANGRGYKTPAGSTMMTALEKKVDDAVAKVLEG